VGEVRFYHLRASTLERTLPKLLEKVLARGERAVVVAGAERLAALDAAMWTYDDRAFLPHGRSGDAPPAGIAGADYASQQPIWLSERIENPNDARVLVLGEPADEGADLAAWPVAVQFIDGADEAAIEAARARWREYKAAGCELSYWTQGEDGGWSRSA
jgi:DNA polymerase-3 subunit chi